MQPQLPIEGKWDLAAWPEGIGCRPSLGSMHERTRSLWAKQDQHQGDRWRLFRAVGDAVAATKVLYPGSYVDVAPSFVWPSVTYVDVDRRAKQFFDDREGVQEIVANRAPAAAGREFRFIQADYTEPLDLPEEGFDLLISLYAGFVSEHCTRYLRRGGTLLVNPSHGDAAMASIDNRYELCGVVISRNDGYAIGTDDLNSYLTPKKPVEITPELLHQRGRGIGYTRSAFAYQFTRLR